MAVETIYAIQNRKQRRILKFDHRNTIAGVVYS